MQITITGRSASDDLTGEQMKALEDVSFETDLESWRYFLFNGVLGEYSPVMSVMDIENAAKNVINEFTPPSGKVEAMLSIFKMEKLDERHEKLLETAESIQALCSVCREQGISFIGQKDAPILESDPLVTPYL